MSFNVHTYFMVRYVKTMQSNEAIMSIKPQHENFANYTYQSCCCLYRIRCLRCGEIYVMFCLHCRLQQFELLKNLSVSKSDGWNPKVTLRIYFEIFTNLFNSIQTFTPIEQFLVNWPTYSIISLIQQYLNIVKKQLH